ncbi:MAG TPA: hypothetical protein V6D17_06465 [Candidatus Obscuribacterales bacterium]
MHAAVQAAAGRRPARTATITSSLNIYGVNVIAFKQFAVDGKRSIMAVLLTTTLFSSAALSLSACGGNDKQVSYKSGGMTHTIQEGEGAVPQEFSKLIYPNAQATGSVSAEGNDQEQSKFAMLSCTTPVDDVSKWYQDQLRENGWEITNVQPLPKMVSISAKKGEVEMNVMIADDGGKTTISLSLGKTIEATPDESEADNYTPDKVTPPTD